LSAAIDVLQLDAQPPVATTIGTHTVTLTTSAAVASGGFIELLVCWFGISSVPTITVTGTNGLTWTTDAALNQSFAYGLAMLSAQAPSGLPSGSTIIVTSSGTPGEIYAIARSFTGVAGSAAGQESKTASGITTAAWTTGLSAALGGDSHLSAGALNDQSGSVTDSIATFGWSRTTLQGNTTSGSTRDFIYRTDGATGNTYQAQGTWSTAPFGGCALEVAYRDGTAVEFARPDSDVSGGAWLDKTGSNVNLFSSIDEATADDLDYIQSSASPSTADVTEVGLSNITP
jgi:hypothetical protein